MLSGLWAVPSPGQTTGTEIVFQRVDAERWQVEYRFSAPIEALRVFPPVLGFRAGWALESGFSLAEDEAGAVIRRTDGVFERLRIDFSASADFGPKSYVPVLPFSDGGAAIYSGHFSADLLHRGEWSASPTRFRLQGREGEHVLVPAWASEQRPVYLYAGPFRPLYSEQAVLVADPEMPAWLQETFRAAVPAVTAIFAERLGLHLAEPPLVLIAAGELADYAGYSVKGGGLDGQFTIMLRGTDLLAPSAEHQRMFEKMVAHELLHVWQQAMPGGAGNDDQPWLHEGSADALAVAALAEAGLWSEQEVRAFHHEQQRTCRESLGGTNLAEAASAGNWTAIYACGYLEFTENVDDAFALFLRLAAAAEASKAPYTQAMLGSLR